MKGKHSRMRLQITIVSVTIIAIGVVFFLGSRVYYETEKMALEQFNWQQLILARSAATGIESYFKELIAALVSLTKMPSFQQMTPECLQHMQHTYYGFPTRTSLRLLDKNGILLYIYPFDSWRGEHIGRDFSEESYFQDARETGNTITSGLIINEQGERRIRTVVPIYLTNEPGTLISGDDTDISGTSTDPGRSESNEFQGVLVASLDPYIIARDLIHPIVSGWTGYAWVIDRYGTILSHPEESFRGGNAFEVRKEKNPDISYEAVEQIQLKMMAGEEGTGRYISGWHREKTGEVEKLIAYTPAHINSHIWSVAVCAPVDEVEQIARRIERITQYILTFVVLAMISGGVFIFIISFRWSRSLEREVERKTGELKQTGDYLNNLIRHSPAPIIVWDPGRRVTIFNKAFERITGQKEAEMIDQPLDVLFPGESRSDSLKKIESASKGKKWESVKIPVIHRDGTTRIVLWNSANIYNEDGSTLIATIAQGQDITERERAREALKESEEKYRLLVENANDAIFIVKDEVIKFSNPATEKITGYSAGELAKLSFISLIHPEDRDVIHDMYNREIEGEELPPASSFRIIDKDGEELFVQLQAVPVTWEEAPAALNFLRDITQQKKLETRLQQVQRIEALGTLAGGIAHDFNNLLMGIQGNISLVLLDNDLSNIHREKLKNTEQCVQSGAELTKQLLGLARGGKYEARPTDLNELIEETSAMFGRTKKEIRIYRKYQKDIWTVEADQGQIEQLLLNLYVNAWQAMPEGGDLYLQSENVTLDENYIKPYHVKPGRYVKISVTDTGTGMDEVTRQRIFEPFFTTKKMGRGTGLGLASAYGIVKNHGGIINVYSEKGEGTTFNIYLPASETKITEMKKDTEEILKGTETVLLVDDEDVIINVGSLMLKELGYEVLIARNGSEAIELYKTKKDSIDMVILDMIMPDMSGGEVYAELKELNPGIKVLLSSGYSINGKAREILERGCSGFIQKPFNMMRLSQKIREILECAM